MPLQATQCSSLQTKLYEIVSSNNELEVYMAFSIRINDKVTTLVVVTKILHKTLPCICRFLTKVKKILNLRFEFQIPLLFGTLIVFPFFNFHPLRNMDCLTKVINAENEKCGLQTRPNIKDL